MRISLAMGLIFTLAACSGGNTSLSSLNPFNMFRGAGAQNQDVALSLAPRRGYGFGVDTRPLIDQVTAVSIEKTATGAIVRATGLSPAQGYHSADLVRIASSGAGDITFQFRVRPPGQLTQIGPTRLREIVAGQALSFAQLRGIRRIIVIGGRNSRTVRR